MFWFRARERDVISTNEAPQCSVEIALLVDTSNASSTCSVQSVTRWYGRC